MNPVFILMILVFIQCHKTDIPVRDQSKDSVITIDITKRIANVSGHPGGVVACWLMDSDKKRPRKTSFADAMKDMGVKFIRFPYGHLADNYLWDADGDWGNTLTPKVATFSQAPASWDWAVNPATGQFINDMDFDEYISICKKTGAQPMVVVNILSYKYENGPTYDQLKESAVQWVRYVNITKGYQVKYWALGNEIDHHSSLISLDEYKLLYADFAKAMKAVDPDIRVGPGLLGNWHAEMLASSPQLIDFVCVHNYLYKYSWRNQDYEGWKNATDILVNNVEKCQQAVSNSSVPDIEIHVTEMNARPWENKSDSDDLFRALAYGEMLMNAIGFKNVKATYGWNTHGPWNGPDGNEPYNFLDLDNNREPRGDITKIINENLLDYLVSVPRVNGYIRAYASVSANNDRLTIFLMNKNDLPEEIDLETAGFIPGKEYAMYQYAGNGPYDKSPKYSPVKKVTIINNTLSVKLQPVSFNIIQLKNQNKN